MFIRILDAHNMGVGMIYNVGEVVHVTKKDYYWEDVEGYVFPFCWEEEGLYELFGEDAEEEEEKIPSRRDEYMMSLVHRIRNAGPDWWHQYTKQEGLDALEELLTMIEEGV